MYRRLALIALLTSASSAQPIDVAMLGLEYFFQAIYIDPGAAPGISYTRGLRVVIGSGMS